MAFYCTTCNTWKKPNQLRKKIKIEGKQNQELCNACHSKQSRLVAQTKSLQIEPQLKTKPQIKIVYLQGKLKLKPQKQKQQKTSRNFLN